MRVLMSTYSEFWEKYSESVVGKTEKKKVYANFEGM